ncbi:MAG: hypothetical protein OHK0017_01730 [Patescibacteria group bacterium]
MFLTSDSGEKLLPSFSEGEVGGLTTIQSSDQGTATLIQTILNYAFFLLTALGFVMIPVGIILAVVFYPKAKKRKWLWILVGVSGFVMVFFGLIGYTIATIVVNFTSSLDIQSAP